MTALLEETDRLYERTQETDVTVVETEETITEDMDATDAKERDSMDATEMEWPSG